MRIKHTPGPWAIYCCEPGQRNGMIYSESLPESSASICDLVADTCIKDNDRRRGDKWVFSDRRAADARLIAAAPDLLAALESVLLDANVEMPAERAALIQSVINQAKGI